MQQQQVPEYSGFNSILVRLKVKFFAGTVSICNVFQFHTGSIKSRLRWIIPQRNRSSFNSILVRLKGRSTPSSGRGIESFNSILVRLKDRPQHNLHCFYLSFNSILVRLKAKNRVSHAKESETFQFHTGSIKRLSANMYAQTIIDVSIPYWFD